jgi:hypothetical protein
MTPTDANLFAERAQAVATANSAYRNLLYIVNRDRKRLARDKAALSAADALSAEYHTLQKAIAAYDENYVALIERRRILDDARLESRSTLETAKFNYDDILREIEALKLARVASAFPKSEESSRYVITRLIGDQECLACGAEGGPLIDKWSSTVAEGDCLVCGASQHDQEKVVPPVAVDSARLAKAEARLTKARQAWETAASEAQAHSDRFDRIQGEIDELVRRRAEVEGRVRQISGTLPPSPPAVQALEDQFIDPAQ